MKFQVLLSVIPGEYVITGRVFKIARRIDGQGIATDAQVAGLAGDLIRFDQAAIAGFTD